MGKTHAFTVWKIKKPVLSHRDDRTGNLIVDPKRALESALFFLNRAGGKSQQRIKGTKTDQRSQHKDRGDCQ